MIVHCSIGSFILIVFPTRATVVDVLDPKQNIQSRFTTLT